MANYYKLGKLSNNLVDVFKLEIEKLKSHENYQWIKFNDKMQELFLEIFSSKELTIQKKDNGEYVQKVFYSAPGHGFRIHKDGIRCKSALNIAISSNESDWVRWYNEDFIRKLSKCTTVDNEWNNYGLSRNTEIYQYDAIPFEDELRVEVGDIYILNVDKFHSFKCNGPNPRIIMQTKFENFPSLDELYKKISINNFKIQPNEN
jgi:hypothetical protein